MEHTSAKVIAAGAMANTDVIVQKALDMRGRKTASFQAFYTSSAVGVLDFLQSNRVDAIDPVTGAPDVTKFTALVSPAQFSAQQPNGSRASGVFGFADMACEYLLARYTNTSGTGVLDVYGVGGHV
jgi:hypothetical protein